MARVRLVLDVDGMSMAELKQYVHDVDEALSGEGNGIAVDLVTEVDIVQTLLAEDDVAYRVINEAPPRKPDLEQMGQMLNDVVMNPENPSNPQTLRHINEAVYDMARKAANVRAVDVADENLENDARVLHYWALTSTLMAKVYMEAAQGLYYVKGWM